MRAWTSFATSVPFRSLASPQWSRPLGRTPGAVMSAAHVAAESAVRVWPNPSGRSLHLLRPSAALTSISNFTTPSLSSRLSVETGREWILLVAFPTLTSTPLNCTSLHLSQLTFPLHSARPSNHHQSPVTPHSPLRPPLLIDTALGDITHFHQLFILFSSLLFPPPHSSLHSCRNISPYTAGWRDASELIGFC